MIEVARAVQVAHDAKIWHRDIKPANVMMTGDDYAIPVLLDFGCATAQKPAPGERLGTPAYMSPEQVRREVVDARTDVWSLGVVLYEALTGQHPFARHSESETYSAVLEGEIRKPDLQLMPRDLATVLRTALSRDTGVRYSNAGALADDLSRVLENRPIVAAPSPWWRRTLQWFERNPVPALAGFVLLVGILALAQQYARAEWNAREALASGVKARESAAASAMTAGRLFAKQGMWDEALRDFSRARERGYDGVETTLAEIEVLEGKLLVDEALARLVKLRESGGLTDSQRARVALLDADLAVNRLHDPEQKLAQARSALESGLLSPADTAYAEALLSPSVRGAKRHLETAIALDGYHRRAISMYAIVLLASGELDAADRLASALRLQTPRDASALGFSSIVAALRGDDVRAKRDLDAARQLVRGGARGVLELQFDAATLLRDIGRSLAESPVDGGPEPMALLRWIARALTAFDKTRKARTFRLCPAVARHYLAIADAARISGWSPKLDALEEVVESAAKDTGDAMMFHFAGLVHMVRTRAAKAEKLFSAAASANESLIPRHVSRFMELDAQYAQFQVARDADSVVKMDAIRARATATIAPLVSSAELSVGYVHPACLYAMSMGLTRQGEILNARWRYLDPKQPMARTVYADQLRRRGHPEAALRIVRDVLSEHPSHESAQKLLRILQK